MSVYYKFKNSVEGDKVTFDGLHISVGDLKKAILQQKKFGKSNDFDLKITNAQTNEVYTTDDLLIQKNTTVYVARIPITTNKKQWKDSEQNLNLINNIDHAMDKIVSSDLSNFDDETEDEKLKTIMTQSTQDYDQSKFLKTRVIMNGPVPANYVCYRCGKGGHYIKQCPTNANDVKRSTGIPRSFMMPAKADQKGALITASGEYVVPIIDHQAYKQKKVEKPPFVPTENPEFNNKIEIIPEELQCLLCKNILHDAVMIPCCSNSYCDDCIRTYLLESDEHKCPTCLNIDISPDTLLPNRYLRNKVHKFKNDISTLSQQANDCKQINKPTSSNLTVENLKINEDHSLKISDYKLEDENKTEIKSPALEEEKMETDSKDLIDNKSNIDLDNKNDKADDKLNETNNSVSNEHQLDKANELDKQNESNVEQNESNDIKEESNNKKEESNDKKEESNDEKEDLDNKESNDLDQINEQDNTVDKQKSIKELNNDDQQIDNKQEINVKEQQLNEESNNKSITNGPIGHQTNNQSIVGNQPYPQNPRTNQYNVVVNNNSKVINPNSQALTRHSILGNPPVVNTIATTNSQQRNYVPQINNNNNYNQQQQQPYLNNNYPAENYQNRGSHSRYSANYKPNNQMQQQPFNNPIFNNQQSNQGNNLNRYGQPIGGPNYYNNNNNTNNQPDMYNNYNGQIHHNNQMNHRNYMNQDPYYNSYEAPGYGFDQNNELLLKTKYDCIVHDNNLPVEDKLDKFAKLLEARNYDDRNSRSRSKSKPHHRSRSRSKNFSSRSSSYSSDSSSQRSLSRSTSRSRSRSIHKKYGNDRNYRSRYSRSPIKYHNQKDYYGQIRSKYDHHLKRQRSPMQHHVANVGYALVSNRHNLEKDYHNKRSSDYHHHNKRPLKNIEDKYSHSSNHHESSSKRKHHHKEERSSRQKEKKSSHRHHRSSNDKKSPKTKDEDLKDKNKIEKLEKVNEEENLKNKLDNKLNKEQLNDNEENFNNDNKDDYKEQQQNSIESNKSTNTATSKSCTPEPENIFNLIEFNADNVSFENEEDTDKMNTDSKSINNKEKILINNESSDDEDDSDDDESEGEIKDDSKNYRTNDKSSVSRSIVERSLSKTKESRHSDSHKSKDHKRKKESSHKDESKSHKKSHKSSKDKKSKKRKLDDEDDEILKKIKKDKKHKSKDKSKSKKHKSKDSESKSKKKKE